MGTKENNKKHQEALQVVKDFEKADGKVTRIKSDAIGNGWQAPVPRRLKGK